MSDDTQKYTQFYRNAYEAFRAGDMEAFVRLSNQANPGFGIFDSPFEGYRYSGHVVPKDAIYLSCSEYQIV